MDPQQRLSLLAAFEAVEHAGLALDTLRDTRLGVYIGAASDEFRRVQAAAATPIGPYSGTGAIPSVIAGRIAYVLGTRGPTLTVDTACSSSLVALHLATRALRGDEAELALVGGVNLLLSPEVSAYFGAIRATSPTGLCTPFEEGADGYVRGEGVVFLVLAKLSVARREGLRVLGVIAGTAINHDGRSAGLTAPSGPAQEAVVRAALADAGRDASAVDYVEAHGTGTPLGDPIEAHALGRVFGTGEKAVGLGSVKANVGHLEAAAGLVSVVKVLLALEEGVIHPQPSVRAPSTKIRWSDARVALLREKRPWPRDASHRRLAGVSSFGLSGTNAHVLLEDAPQEGASHHASGSRDGLVAPLVLSARDGDSLAVLARRMADRLEAGDARFEDVLSHAALRRSHHAHRLAVQARDADSAMRKLRAFPEQVSAAHTRASRPMRPVFVFSGQGTQWVGMAKTLAEKSAVFRGALLDVRAAFATLTPLDPVGMMLEARAPLERISEIQPAIFAVQVGLAALLRALGVEPAGVVGHSMGEVAAAYVSGALDLAQAARVIVLRSALVETTRGEGTMAAVELAHGELERAIARHGVAVDIAALNAPQMSLVAGTVPEVTRFVTLLEAEGTFARRLSVDYASHSRAMDPLLATLEARLGEMVSREPSIPMWSSVTARCVKHDALGARYWARNLRTPVRFTDALRLSIAEGFDTFLELSPHPSIIQGVDALLAEQDVRGFCTGTLRRDTDDVASVQGLLGDLWVRGAKVAFGALCEPAFVAGFPLTPFRCQSFPLPRPRDRQPETQNPNVRVHADALAGHEVLGRAIAPAMLYVELGLGLADADLEALVFHAPLDLTQGTEMLDVSREAGAIAVSSSGARVASARTGARASVRAERLSYEGERVHGTELYERLARMGLSYGERFALVREAFLGDGRVTARVELMDAAPHALARLLDACLHAVVLLLPDDGRCRVPVRVARVRAPHRMTPSTLVCVASRAGEGAFDVRVCDASGEVLVALEGLELGALETHETAGTAPARYAVRYAALEGTSSVSPSSAWHRIDVSAATDDAPRMTLRVLDGLRDALARDPVPRVCVVTRGAVAPEREGAIAQAAARGLARSVAREHPEIGCVLVDLPAETSGGEAALVETALSLAQPGDELRIRGGKVERASLVPALSIPLEPRAYDALALRVPSPGVLGGLAVTETRRRAPAPSEVEVEVHACGVNFRDVMLALGLVPDGTKTLGEEPLLGSELAGVVVRAGEAHTHLVGKRVMGIAFGAMASHVVTDARLVTEVPSTLALDAAAGQVVAHLTVRFALDTVARVQPGERVLVHSAAGAVGLAAVDHAVRRGCRVLATAGTEEKRALARAHGAELAADSRSLSFTADVRAFTEGEGVDVVLSSLSAEATTKSVELLRDFGRFVELGKRDAYEGRSLPIRPFLRNLSFALVDLVELARRRPEVVAALLAEIARDLASGAARLVPTRVHGMEDAERVFHAMARGAHTGKQVLRAPVARRGAASRGLDALTVRPDAAYLITGGLGALGLGLAARLAALGARELLLLGRSAPSQEALAAVEILRADGVRVSVHGVDAADEAALAGVLPGATAPLRGIVHAAGVLEDALAENITELALRRVLRSKLDAGLALHRATRACDLDFFAVLSSAAGVLGSPGQGAYAAANAAVDALVSHRRSLGLPGISFALGPVAAVGLAAADAKRGARLAQMGIRSMEADAAFDAMLACTVDDPATVTILDVDHTALARTGIPIPLLAGAASGAAPAAQTSVDASFVASLRGMPGREAERALLAHVTALLARTLRADTSTLDATVPLQSLGLDSMMAIELKNRLQSSLGLTLAATLVFRFPTLEKITAHLVERLELGAQAADAAEAPAAAETEGAALEGLDTEALRALLAAELEEVNGA